MEKYCQVGGHPMVDGEEPGACVVCRTTFCSKHRGNDPLPGELMACPNHVHQVDGMNKDNWKRFMKERDRRS